ncbi:MAG: hypothetical protein LUG46_04875 [Erysipelotrichaceae bacterium]|nr:hypothetical protein [Erysipelotrichaceae bacterium]
MGFHTDNKIIKEHLLTGGFGLEKESLRVNLDGYLSHVEHPFLGNPYIDRDFCENQVEMITDACDSCDSAYRDMEIIHKQTVKSLYTLETGREILWPFSNPPFVKGESDIPVAMFEGEQKGKEVYRQYLAHKYGKTKMLFSGIHVNYSFDNELLEAEYQYHSHLTFQEFKDQLYLELAQKVVYYIWMIVYLTAASPILDKSYKKDMSASIYHDLGSARCSEIGYWNDFVPILKYDSVASYVDSIQKYVDEGLLKASSELYYPVRLKPKGLNSNEHLRQTGINHIELRVFDLNPFSPIGIIKEDLRFVNLFIVYLMSLDKIDLTDSMQKLAISNEKAAARYDDSQIFIDGMNIKDKTKSILDDMDNYFDDETSKATIQYQKDKLKSRYVERIVEQYSDNYVGEGLRVAIDNAIKICKEREI